MPTLLCLKESWRRSGVDMTFPSYRSERRELYGRQNVVGTMFAHLDERQPHIARNTREWLKKLSVPHSIRWTRNWTIRNANLVPRIRSGLG